MSKEADYKFERYEQYWGPVENVKKIISHCPACGAKLLHSHLPDYKNLIVQETSRCIECGEGTKKLIHVLN